MQEHPSAQIAGARVDGLGMESVTDTVIRWALDNDKPRLAVGVNAHVCNLARRDGRFRRLLDNSDLNYADGQSIVWAARAFRIRIPERVATTDLALPVLRRAAREDIPVYFYGGRPGVAEQAAQAMRLAVPGVRIATHHGYVAAGQMDAVLEDMRAHNTRLLFVGLGDPNQQEWVHQYGEDSGAGAILTCGGLFDWLSGGNKRAPRWMITAGLEWLWRLIIEPKRLAHRYLVGNPSFAFALARQLVSSSVNPPHWTSKAALGQPE